MSKLSITKTASEVHVQSPYNALFVKGARLLSGKFSGGVWTFDVRDEDRVRSLCGDVYGSDGVISNTCTVRLEMPRGASATREAIDFYGFTLARAFGRDSGAKISEGIVVLEGGFYSSGSVKNWATMAKDGTVVLLREFPRHRAQRIVSGEEKSEWPGWTVTIEDERPPVDIQALEDEKARLLSRLEEIENTLSSVREDQP
jgi:hypothetical protein